ncbi:MAG: carotenoid oxygenase family protein [Deltaproteobacteria bacterium]|nr:carotenoid oxygenase family protein [Deltaproteobacteria bacterium]
MAKDWGKDVRATRRRVRRRAERFRRDRVKGSPAREFLARFKLVKPIPDDPEVEGGADPASGAYRSPGLASASVFSDGKESAALVTIAGMNNESFAPATSTRAPADPSVMKTMTPACLNRADRAELVDEALIPIGDSRLPDDMGGYFFAMCVTGSTANGLPRGGQERWAESAQSGMKGKLLNLLPEWVTAGATTTVLNSDAFILRFDLTGEAPVLTSRIGRGPDWYADDATQPDDAGSGPSKPSWPDKFAFRDSGLLRFNWLLGLRNMNNTAFQPVPTRKDGNPPRMLVTWDAGQPWEIDTQTLEFVTPVGRRDQWTAEALGGMPFPIVFTSAHPMWDHATDEGFFINYGKGLLGLMEGLPVVRDTKVFWRYLDSHRIRLMYDLNLDTLVEIEKTAKWLVAKAAQELTPDRFAGVLPQSFLHLKVWDGQSETLKTYNLQEEGLDVEIAESVHQIAVTRNFVVVMDTGFKVGINTLYGDKVPGARFLAPLIRTYTTRTVRPYATLHVIPRSEMRILDSKVDQAAELNRAVEDMFDDVVKNEDGSYDIEAFRVDLPVAACHFVANFEDEGNRLVLHVGHCDATDVSEWLRTEDRGVIKQDLVPRDLLGLPSLSGMDINRLAKYTIDCRAKRLVESKILEQEPHTWTIALYAHHTSGACVQPPDRFENLYWCSMGFFEDLAFGRLYGLYRNYIHRTVPVEGITAMLKRMGSQPATLFRLDTDIMEVADSWVFAEGWVCSSPQFVRREGPRNEDGWRVDDQGNAVSPEQDGYLVVIAYGPDPVAEHLADQERVPELQIFDAADLASGPISRFYSPQARFGYSIHSAHIDAIGPRNEDYKVEVMKDLLEGRKGEVADFLRETVGPHFD